MQSLLTKPPKIKVAPKQNLVPELDGPTKSSDNIDEKVSTLLRFVRQRKKIKEGREKKRKLKRSAYWSRHWSNETFGGEVPSTKHWSLRK